MAMPTDPNPYDLTRALAAENAELQPLLEAVAQELKRLCRG